MDDPNTAFMFANLVRLAIHNGGEAIERWADTDPKGLRAFMDAQDFVVAAWPDASAPMGVQFTCIKGRDCLVRDADMRANAIPVATKAAALKLQAMFGDSSWGHEDASPRAMLN